MGGLIARVPNPGRQSRALPPKAIKTIPLKGRASMDLTTEMEGEVVFWPLQDTAFSIEEMVEAEPIAEIVRGHVDGPTHERPTAMDRLQALHERLDELLGIHTRSPEQILLDAALAAEGVAAQKPTRKPARSGAELSGRSANFTSRWTRRR
jgi:hypothetical protein